jgi:FG-GAP repeat
MSASSRSQGRERARLLRAVFALGAIGLLSHVTSASAAYVQQGEKLVAEGEVGPANAGRSVALSADGNTALVGGLCDGYTRGSEGPCTGAVWVFTRSGSKWSQQGAKLTPNSGEESAEGEFGSRVALSADGNTALIGAACDGRTGSGGSCSGAVWVFTRSGSTWSQQGAKLTPTAKHPIPPNGAFGSGLALSADGNTALIGEPGERHGAVWVFTRSGSTWSQQGSKLTASGGQGRGSTFGASLALSADGNEALIGAPGDNRTHGAAWVFTRSAAAWSQQSSKLTGICARRPPRRAYRGLFGSSVALSADGNTALIGEPFCTYGCRNAHCEYEGSAYVFTHSGSGWSQQGATVRSGQGFGRSLALSADGNTALIASPGECKVFFGCWQGAAQEFARSGEIWTRQGEPIMGSGEVYAELHTVEFGASVALSSEATTALIGGPHDSEGIGAAWVFVH